MAVVNKISVFFPVFTPLHSNSSSDQWIEGAWTVCLSSDIQGKAEQFDWSKCPIWGCTQWETAGHKGNQNTISKIKGYGPQGPKTITKIIMAGGFPGGSVVKNPPASAGDTGSTPGPGRSRMLQSNYWAWGLQVRSPRATATEACAPAARALQREKPLQWEARSLQCKEEWPSTRGN